MLYKPPFSFFLHQFFQKMCILCASITLAKKLYWSFYCFSTLVFLMGIETPWKQHLVMFLFVPDTKAKLTFNKHLFYNGMCQAVTSFYFVNIEGLFRIVCLLNIVLCPTLSLVILLVLCLLCLYVSTQISFD